MIYNAILFFVFKLFQWSERSEPAVPMLGVTFAIAIFNFFLAISIANILYMTTGIDLILNITTFEDKFAFTPIIVVWFFSHYFILEKGGIKKAALEKFSNAVLPRCGSLAVLSVICFNIILLFTTTALYMTKKF